MYGKGLFTPALFEMERFALKNKKSVQAPKKSREGFSLVEVLGVCPTNLHRSPEEATAWAKENMAYFPLGEFKTP